MKLYFTYKFDKNGYSEEEVDSYSFYYDKTSQVLSYSIGCLPVGFTNCVEGIDWHRTLEEALPVARKNVAKQIEDVGRVLKTLYKTEARLEIA